MIAARGLLRGLLPLIMAASVSDAQRTGSEPDTTIERVLRPARLPEREGVEGMAGLRARVVTRDSTGTRFRLDGDLLRADSTRFELRCKSHMVPSLPGSSPITSGAAPQACDGAATTALWKDVQQLHVRRARAASISGTLQNGANGVVGGGLFGAALGAGGALLFDLALSSSEDSNGNVRPRVYWSHVRFGALAVGGIGAVTGGLVTTVWSRGIWVRVAPARSAVVLRGVRRHTRDIRSIVQR